MSKEKKLLSPTNTAYLLKPGHDQIFYEVKEWISDIEFYQMEIDFFIKLLDKAFLRITNRQETTEIESLDKKLKKFKDDVLAVLLKRVLDYENQLGEVEESAFYEGEIRLLVEQSEFRTNINSVTRQIKKLKTEVYDIVEKQMRVAKNINADYQDGKIAL